MSTVTERDDQYIAGRFVPTHASRRISIVDPTTGERIASVPDGDGADVHDAVAAAREALPAWRETSGAERAAHLRALADAFDVRRDEMAALVTAQNGSPAWFSNVVNGRAPVRSYRESADAADALEVEEVVEDQGGATLLRREPLGVVGVIVPWNAPQGLLASRVGPALAAGCTVVVKPSPEVALADYALAEILDDAGLPPGVVNIVVGGRETGAALIRHPGTDKISFTGSTAAGRDVAAACGQALKPISAELGGKSAAIVLRDAELETVAAAVVPQCIPNSGQVCYSLTRILAPVERFADIVNVLTATLAAAPVGDPADAETIFGPLVTDRQRARVEEYIASGVAEGARVVFGGRRPDEHRAGWFVEPTVFVDVDPTMRIFREEIFGPVLTVVPYDSEDAAIDLANDSTYGLSGAVFSADVEHATAVARRLQTGRILLNARGATRLMAGYKDSGLGREGGAVTVSSYQQVKGISQPR